MNCPCAVLSYYAVYVVPFMVRRAPYSVKEALRKKLLKTAVL